MQGRRKGKGIFLQRGFSISIASAIKLEGGRREGKKGGDKEGFPLFHARRGGEGRRGF